MRFIENGKVNQPIVLLIHGMGCTGERSFSSSLPKLKDKYRVIVACLDGYDEPTNTFTTIYDQAKKIADYITEKCDGRIDIVLGMSMGGFIALELLANYDVKAERLILDSGYLKPWNKVRARLMSKMVGTGFLKIMKGKEKAIHRAGMRYSMGYCFRRSDLCSFASKVTIQNSEYSCLTYELPNLKSLKGIKVEYWYGQKERYMIEGMKVLKEKMPNMKEVCVGNYGHGEMMMEQPEKYGDMIAKAITAD